MPLRVTNSTSPSFFSRTVQSFRSNEHFSGVKTFIQNEPSMAASAGLGTLCILSTICKKLSGIPGSICNVLSPLFGAGSLGFILNTLISNMLVELDDYRKSCPEGYSGSLLKK